MASARMAFGMILALHCVAAFDNTLTDESVLVQTRALQMNAKEDSVLGTEASQDPSSDAPSDPVIPTTAPVIPTVAPLIPTVAPAIPTVAPVIPTVAPVIPTVAPVIPTAATGGAERQPGAVSGAGQAIKESEANPTKAALEPEAEATPTPAPTPPTPSPTPTAKTLIGLQMDLKVPDAALAIHSAQFKKGVSHGFAAFLVLPTSYVFCKFPSEADKVVSDFSVSVTVIIPSGALPPVANAAITSKVDKALSTSMENSAELMDKINRGIVETSRSHTLYQVTSVKTHAANEARTTHDADPATILGDPHVTNIRGESFEIMQTGKMSMLHIPRGSKNPDLTVHADIVSLQDCRLRYIKNLEFTGKWVGELGRVEFVAGGMEQPSSFQARVGNGQWVPSHDMKSLERDLMKGGINSSAVTKWYAREMRFQLGTVNVRVWQNNKKIHIKKETSMFLNLAVDNLKSIKDLQVGGLLGIDDHTVAEKDDSCKGQGEQHNRVLFSMSDDLKFSQASASLEIVEPEEF